MKAVVYEKFGPPEVLQLKDIPKPEPKDSEVLIKIVATTVHRGDSRMRSLDIPVPGWQKIMARLFLGIRRPKRKILGMELSGVIEQVGSKVTKFKIGDQVFASTIKANFGAYAEYKCMKEDGIIALKPINMSFEEAATVPNGAYTALGIIRQAKIQPEMTVLIYGASGSVGSFAIQFAKNLGAKVTAVCSTKSIERIKSLGVDRIIDYTTPDFITFNDKFDVFLDAVGILPKATGKNFLKPNGIYLNVHSASNKIKEKQEIVINELKDMIEQGKLKTVIDRKYTLEDIVEGHRYVDTGHKKGNVVINVTKEP
ncbi:MAG: NAD(P)-dependent alcohol dehydrogenase [Candidatus Hodarchaeota archaeon]